MVFFRNVQFRYMPIMTDKSTLTLALERPGASGDPGTLANRVEIQNIAGRSPIPDFSASYIRNYGWGYVRAAGIVRRIAWDDTLADQFDLSGPATGWGLNFSSNLKPTKNDVVRIQVVYGKGIQNYMNDSPVDVGAVLDPGNAVTPVGANDSAAGHGVLPRSHLERQVVVERRVLAPGQRQHGRPGAGRLPSRLLCARQSADLPSARRHGGRRIPVGPA
jgi:hypothetical protein